MFQKEFILEQEESSLIPVNLKNWIELTTTSKNIREKIADLMKVDLSGECKTGFSPYMKEGQIMFEHRWLLLIGIKNDKQKSRVSWLFL